MSFPVKPLQLDFLSNKDTEVFCLSDDSDDAFNFKYVSNSQFKHIIKDVRRRRMKEKEERNWASFTREQESARSCYRQKHVDYPGVSNVKKLLRESTEEVDPELKRLREDSQPERKKSTSKSRSVDRRTTNPEENAVESPKGMLQSKDAAGSINTLLTIPEEINTRLARERSPVSKLECTARKSHSECILRPKRESRGRFNHATNDSEYNYSSGLSQRHEDSEQEDSCDVRPHPVVAHKILGIQKKISELLDEIAFRLNRIPLPDGDRDLQRRQQRVMEFAIRCSRNYLYDLGRQISDIQRHVRAISPCARVKPTRRGVSLHMQAIEQKLTTAHQLLLHALSAYCKHIPSSVLKGQPGKLEEILQAVVDLKDICSKVHLTTAYFACGDVKPTPLGKDTQKRCSAILMKLRVSSDNESQLVSRTSQPSPVGGLRNKKCSNRTDNCKNFPARLSMYSVDPRLSRNPRSRKLAPPRSRERIRSSVVPRTPPKHHRSTPERPNPSPAVFKSSKEIAKRRKTKICLPQREDEISTMMSALATDSDAASSITLSAYPQPPVSIHKGTNSRKFSFIKPPAKHSKALNVPINAKLVANDDQYTERVNQITDQQLSSLVPVIAELMTLITNQNDLAIQSVPSDAMDALMELLKKYRSSASPSVPSSEEPNVSARISRAATNYDNSRGSTKKSMETRSGAKNMQLICLTSGENTRETHGSVASEACYEKADQAQGASTTFNPATKNREITTLRVSETSLKALLKYRDDYQNASRSNPMYTSNGQNKPWDVVAWIADKLVDELIVDISEELQIKDTIRELFVSEFKEF